MKPLSWNTVRVLEDLKAHPGATLSEIAERTQIEKTKVSETLYGALKSKKIEKTGIFYHGNVRKQTYRLVGDIRHPKQRVELSREQFRTEVKVRPQCWFGDVL